MLSAINAHAQVDPAVMRCSNSHFTNTSSTTANAKIETCFIKQETRRTMEKQYLVLMRHRIDHHEMQLDSRLPQIDISSTMPKQKQKQQNQSNKKLVFFFYNTYSEAC